MQVITTLCVVLCLLATVAGFAPSVRSGPLLQNTHARLMMNNKERTYIMVKPDGVQRNLVGKIIERFESKGFQLKALKLVTPPKAQLEEHYKDLSSKPFFPKVITYMTSGPVVAMVWQGKNAVKSGRMLLGATNPADSAPGTIRGDFALDVGRNICHGSDSVESAEREIGLWFKPDELQEWTSHSDEWKYE